jgi:predicted DNA-binding transcriptional regulator YafY
MNRLERLYAISESIRRAGPRPISAAQLAARFDVSRRTIERDLVSLRSAGVPLYAEHGRAGGTLCLDQLGPVVLTLSAAEASALLIAVAAAGETMPFHDAGVEAAERIVEHLSPTTRIAVEALRAKIRVREQGPVSKRVRRTLEAGLQQGRVVNIAYVGATGNETLRSVEPVGFYNGEGGWYLIGWCHLRGAGRIFRLDRIKRAQLTSASGTKSDVDQTLGWVPTLLHIP